jgi:hypothetical protein
MQPKKTTLLVCTFKRCISPRCWKTVRAARTEFGLLGSEAAKLRAVKE